MDAQVKNLLKKSLPGLLFACLLVPALCLVLPLLSSVKIVALGFNTLGFFVLCLVLLGSAIVSKLNNGEPLDSLESIVLCVIAIGALLAFGLSLNLVFFFATMLVIGLSLKSKGILAFLPGAALLLCVSFFMGLIVSLRPSAAILSQLCLLVLLLSSALAAKTAE
ncbi:MAG: hypothetical protein Q7S86_01550 [bacterium]|nr:hypothetical protein [bacterium]